MVSIAWLLTGSLASAVATLAVAVLGLMMMSGRLPVRRAGHIAVGLMLIFGANAVAQGLIGSVGLSAKAADATQALPRPIEVRPPAAQPYDPYAGASVPVRPSSADPVVIPQ